MSRQDENELDTLKDQIQLLSTRLDEQGILIRRTHTAVTGLAESLGKVLASQKSRERWINLNSFVAYTLFTILLGSGFFMLYSARVGDLVAARDRVAEQRDSAQTQTRTLQDQIARRAAAEKRVLEYYQLLRDDRRAEAIAQYSEIEQQPLTPTERELFANGVKSARAALVDAGYLSGVAAYRAGEYDRAATELHTALAYEDEGPRAAQMRYYLGMAFFKKADFGNAARQLELSIAGRVDQSGVVDARYYLASALDKLGEFERARTEYDKFASTHPTHSWALTARRRSAQLVRQGIRTN
ncbi:MAG: tetratricopeptide repeat protein [Proteobacteria bacterium]|nr:tetratricopeptide repeat protein [Pseudomonadota bacterium]